MSPLEGRTALVTGATRGLGAAIADRLAADGARVVVVGRDPATAAARAESLGGIGVAVDLATEQGVATLLARAEEIGIDALVNNAGISGNGRSHEVPGERIDEILTVNLRAPLVLAARLAAHLAERGGGAIVNVSSALATRGTPAPPCTRRRRPGSSARPERSPRNGARRVSASTRSSPRSPAPT